jgi:hypothetical protein
MAAAIGVAAAAEAVAALVEAVSPAESLSLSSALVFFAGSVGVAVDSEEPPAATAAACAAAVLRLGSAGVPADVEGVSVVGVAVLGVGAEGVALVFALVAFGDGAWALEFALDDGACALEFVSVFEPLEPADGFAEPAVFSPFALGFVAGRDAEPPLAQLAGGVGVGACGAGELVVALVCADALASR